MSNKLTFTLEDILPSNEESEKYVEMWVGDDKTDILADLIKPEHEDLLASYNAKCDDLELDATMLFQSLLRSRMLFEAIKEVSVDEKF